MFEFSLLSWLCHGDILFPFFYPFITFLILKALFMPSAFSILSLFHHTHISLLMSLLSHARFEDYFYHLIILFWAISTSACHFLSKFFLQLASLSPLLFILYLLQFVVFTIIWLDFHFSLFISRTILYPFSLTIFLSVFILIAFSLLD